MKLLYLIAIACAFGAIDAARDPAPAASNAPSNTLIAYPDPYSESALAGKTFQVGDIDGTCPVELIFFDRYVHDSAYLWVQSLPPIGSVAASDSVAGLHHCKFPVLCKRGGGTTHASRIIWNVIDLPLARHITLRGAYMPVSFERKRTEFDQVTRTSTSNWVITLRETATGKTERLKLRF